jgi:hypothetical protein
MQTVVENYNSIKPLPGKGFGDVLKSGCGKK